MRYVNGKQKISWGLQMPVEIPINAEQIIKKAAFEKMQKQKEEYVRPVSNYFDYKLIYKNGITVRHLPRSLQPSVQQECKKALSMLHFWISLYLIEYEDNDDNDDLIQNY